MSLDFDYSNCGKDQTEREALMTHPMDKDRWHPVGDSLVWLSMSCGFNRITADNLDKVWRRIDASQRLYGPVYAAAVDGKRHPLPLTRDDVARYVGLRTNASTKGDQSFWMGLAKGEYAPAGDTSAYEWLAAQAAKREEEASA